MTIVILFWRHQILAFVIGFIKLQNMVKKINKNIKLNAVAPVEAAQKYTIRAQQM